MVRIEPGRGDARLQHEGLGQNLIRHIDVDGRVGAAEVAFAAKVVFVPHPVTVFHVGDRRRICVDAHAGHVHGIDLQVDLGGSVHRAVVAGIAWQPEVHPHGVVLVIEIISWLVVPAGAGVLGVQTGQADPEPGIEVQRALRLAGERRHLAIHPPAHRLVESRPEGVVAVQLQRLDGVFMQHPGLRIHHVPFGLVYHRSGGAIDEPDGLDRGRPGLAKITRREGLCEPFPHPRDLRLRQDEPVVAVLRHAAVIGAATRKG